MCTCNVIFMWPLVSSDTLVFFYFFLPLSTELAESVGKIEALDKDLAKANKVNILKNFTCF